MNRTVLLFLAGLALASCSDTSINLSDFDTSCTKDSDCQIVNVGDICGCRCGNAAINVSSYAAYQTELQSKEQHCGDAQPCECPFNGTGPGCSKGTCTIISIPLDGG